MKFKLDENFGKRTQQLFRMAGHDVQTVREESLQGSPDQSIYDHCCREQRCLVTLDLDFAEVTRFPPLQTAGIAVIQPNPAAAGIFDPPVLACARYNFCEQTIVDRRSRADSSTPV